MSVQPFTLEYNTLFTLTIILIISKLVLVLFLFKRILEKTKEREEFKFDFIFIIFVIFLGLLISRLIYFYYDFFLTLFNPDLLYVYPNVLYWKVANLISNMGQVIAIFLIDKVLLKFRLKGSLSYIFLAISLIQFFYPISTAEDFQIASSIGLFVVLIMIILPIIFIYIGIKTPQLRKYSFIFVLGIAFYFIGSMIDSEFIVSPLQGIFGAQVRLVVFLTSILLKIAGLLIITYSGIKFYI